LFIAQDFDTPWEWRSAVFNESVIATRLEKFDGVIRCVIFTLSGLGTAAIPAVLTKGKSEAREEAMRIIGALRRVAYLHNKGRQPRTLTRV
jgi:hypothetical protein